MLAEQGQELDRALELAQTAKAGLPDLAEVSDTLGWVYYKKGLANLAIAPLQEAVKRDDNNPLYQFHLGLTFAKTGDISSARRALQRAIELKLPAPHLDEAKRVLATVS
jgi:tetratricopeptide (TPR) repeat protein